MDGTQGLEAVKEIKALDLVSLTWWISGKDNSIVSGRKCLVISRGIS